MHDNKILLYINLWYPDVTTATYLRDILYTYWKINLKNKSSMFSRLASYKVSGPTLKEYFQLIFIVLHAIVTIFG